MGANVTIKGEAFFDIRYDALAKLAGLADADHARIKVARLWLMCTEKGTYVLTEPLVNGVVDAQALVTAELADRVEGGLRIRGTVGMVEWLAEAREAKVVAGKARAATAARDSGRFTSGRPAAHQQPLVEAGAPPPAATSPISISPSPEEKNERREEIRILSAPPAGAPPAEPPQLELVVDRDTKPANVVRLPPAPDPDAFLLADRLREAILAGKPNHRVGEEAAWHQTRRAWARQMAKTLRRRPRAALEAAIRFLVDHASDPYACVVESARTFDEKLDRIEMAMGRAVAKPSGGGTLSRGRHVGYAAAPAPWEYPDPAKEHEAFMRGS